MIKWQNRPAEDHASSLGCDLRVGLSHKEAEKRAAEKKNILFPDAVRDGFFGGKRVFFAFLPLLLLLTALAVLLGEEKTAGYILLSATAFSLLFLYLTCRKGDAVRQSAYADALPAVRVLRGGKVCLVPCQAVVEGDLLLLREGDFVPADCRLVESDSLILREGGIAGRDLVPKSAEAPSGGLALTESPNMLLAGTYIHKGSCRALVCRVGADTHFASVLEKKADGFEETGILVSLRTLSAILTAGLLAFIFLITLISFIPDVSLDFLSAFLLSASLAAASLAEFYGVFAYMTAANAVSFARNGEKGGLFRSFSALEDASSVDRVFLSPALFKEGEPRLLLAEPLGAPHAASEELSLPLAALLRDGALALGRWKDVTADEDADRRRRIVERYAARIEVSDHPFLHSGVTESGIAYGAVLCGDTPVVSLLAPLDAFLTCGGYLYHEGKTLPITPERLRAALENSRALAGGDGTVCRSVYAVAVAVAPRLPQRESDSAFVESTLQGGIVLEGFFLFEELLHEESLSALEKAREKGIAVSLFAAEEEIPLGERLGFASADGLEKGRDSLHVGVSRMDKLTLLRASAALGEKAVFVGENTAELSHMKEAYLSAGLGDRLADGSVCGNVDPTGYCTDALRLSARLLIPTPCKGGGGFAALWRALSVANGYVYQIKGIFSYLVTLFALRLVLVLFSVFAPAPLISAELLALSGLIYDLLVILAISRSPIPHKGGVEEKRRVRREMLLSLSVGLVLGVAVAVYALVTKASDLLVIACLFGVSLKGLLTFFAGERIRPQGMAVVLTVLSCMLFAALVIMAAEDILFLLCAVLFSLADLFPSMKGEKKGEKKIKNMQNTP